MIRFLTKAERLALCKAIVFKQETGKVDYTKIEIVERGKKRNFNFYKTALKIIEREEKNGQTNNN